MASPEIVFPPLKLERPEEAHRLLEGGVDLHVHAGPSLIPRRLDAAEAALQGAAAGLKAVLVKDHHLPTARDVQYVRKYALAADCHTEIYGAIALNHTVGGLNPYAVETSLAFGAKIVYLPTISSRAHHEHHQKSTVGVHFPATSKKLLEAESIYLLDQDAQLPPVLELILEIVRDAGAILSLGHVSVKESLAVLGLAQRVDLKKIVVQHPTFIINANDAEMLHFVRLGARVEFSASMSDPRSKFYYIPIPELARLIRLLGVSNCFLGSDLGQHDTPPFIEGLMTVIDGLLGQGFAPAEIRSLFNETATGLLC